MWRSSANTAPCYIRDLNIYGSGYILGECWETEGRLTINPAQVTSLFGLGYHLPCVSQNALFTPQPEGSKPGESAMHSSAQNPALELVKGCHWLLCSLLFLSPVFLCSRLFSDTLSCSVPSLLTLPCRCCFAPFISRHLPNLVEPASF